MRSAFAFAFAAVALFSSAVAQELPACVTTCAGKVDSGSCSSTDYACLCRSDKFVHSLGACLKSACSASELHTAEQTALTLCQVAGVSITLPHATGSHTARPSHASSAASLTVIHGSTLTVHHTKPPVSGSRSPFTTVTRSASSRPSGSTVASGRPSGSAAASGRPSSASHHHSGSATPSGRPSSASHGRPSGSAAASGRPSSASHHHSGSASASGSGPSSSGGPSSSSDSASQSSAQPSGTQSSDPASTLPSTTSPTTSPLTTNAAVMNGASSLAGVAAVVFGLML